MRMVSYLCYAGVEVGNGNRTLQYIRNLGGSRWTVTDNCACSAIDVDTALIDVNSQLGYDSDLWNAGLYDDVVFTNPADDEAPWYDPQRPESAEFLGLYPAEVNLGNVLSREMSPRSGEGGYLSPANLRHRVVSVNGILAASSAAGMYYGERWLTEVLRGCCDSCDGDTLTFLPSCPSTAAGSASDPYFRQLVNVGLIDYVPARQIASLSEYQIQEVSFQLASESPWMYRPGTSLAVGESGPGGLQEFSTYLNDTAPTWPGDQTVEMSVTALTAGVTDIDIIGRVRLEGDTCDSTPTSRAAPCFHYRISSMEQDSIFTIDGRSRRVTYYDPSLKSNRMGFPLLDPYVSDSVRGDMFVWPDVAPCTRMCIEIANNGATGNIRSEVIHYEREL